MTKHLHISPELKLPLDFATKTAAILAQRRKGKTYTASVLAEEMVSAKQPFVALDPTGAWWGLRAGADGQSAGLPVIVLGGQHGDVPLERTGGKLVADLVVDEPGYYVIDFSLFESGEAERQFAVDFAERLYRAKGQPGKDFPLHLFVDEADRFVPQNLRKGSGETSPRLLGAFEAIVRRGGLRGLGTTLISQRAAVVNKNVLEQLDVLIALRTVGPNDQGAIESYVKAHGSDQDVKTLKSSLASLELGEAWVWEPGAEPALFERVKIRARRTFNSSATPKPGEKRVEPKRLADVDLAALQKRMADTIEKAKADDPKALRARIAELERAAKAGVPAAAPKPERVEVPMFDAEAFAELERETAKEIVESLDRLRLALGNQKGILHTYKSKCLASNGAKAGLGGAPRPVPPRSLPEAVQPRPADANLGKCERAILSALVQHGTLTLTQAAIIARYSVSSSTPGNAASKLRGLGYVDGSNTGGLSATEAGKAALGPVDPLPTGRELAKFWFANLGRCEAEILAHIVDAYPESVTLKEAAEARGYSTDSSTPGNAASKLRSLALVHGGNAGMTADERLVG